MASETKNTALLKSRDAAARIGKSKSWLDQARMKGTGPCYLKIGAGVFYRPADIDQWLDNQTRLRVEPLPSPEAA